MENSKEARTDHLGREYKNAAAMCAFYGVKYCTFRARRSKGQSIEEALLGTAADGRSNKLGHQVTAPSGDVYRSKAALCRAVGVSYTNYRKKIKNGLSTEEALRKKKQHGIVTDHLGNEFPSITSMCRAHGVNLQAYLYAKKRGRTLADILKNKEKHGAVDHLGNKYRTVSDMCSAYGISEVLFRSRIKNGMTLKAALTRSYRARKSSLSSDEVTDCYGIRHKNLTSLCAHYGISLSGYMHAIKRGRTQEEILSHKCRNGKTVKDHLGNEFASISDLCRSYGITIGHYRYMMSVGKTLFETLHPEKHTIEGPDGNTYRSEHEMCNAYGVSYSSYRMRRRHGLSVKEALIWKKNQRFPDRDESEGGSVKDA